MADTFGLKIGLEGEKEFKKALAEINQSFKALGSEMKLVESQFSKNDNPNQIFLIGDGLGLFVYFEKFGDTHFKNGIIKRPNSKPRGPRKRKLL